MARARMLGSGDTPGSAFSVVYGELHKDELAPYSDDDDVND